MRSQFLKYISKNTFTGFCCISFTAEVEGDGCAILTAERTALNVLIKDNHMMAANAAEEAMERARSVVKKKLPCRGVRND